MNERLAPLRFVPGRRLLCLRPLVWRGVAWCVQVWCVQVNRDGMGYVCLLVEYELSFFLVC